MKKGLYHRVRGNNEVAEGRLIRIHLLVSVHPNNEATNTYGSDNGNYDILILNPKCQESVALIRQIAVIRPRDPSDNKGEVDEKRGLEAKTYSAFSNSMRNNTKNRCAI